MSDTLVIRHLAFEDLGAFAPGLARAGHTLRWHQAGVDDPQAEDPMRPDLVIVLGGPIGAYEDHLYPWLAAETDFIRARMLAQRPTLGICLGAQLMAKALGARVYPAGVKEIGFAPLTLTPAGQRSCLAPYADEPLALHWHGDTFDLPAGAELLAGTPACPHQAFAIGPNLLACQFHPEAGGPGFERWLIGHAIELASAHVDIPALRAEAARHGPHLAGKATRVLETWLTGLRR